MKKQLLFLPLVGLLCFTSCNKSRELSPVDDITGLDRANSIYNKEAMACKQLETNNPLAIFEILPHKISFEIKSVENGNYRVIDTTLQPFNIIEVSKNNQTTYDRRCEINYDNLQFHEYFYNEITNLFYENYFFYDANKSECYVLEETNGIRSKTTIPTADKEAAAVEFGNVLKNRCTTIEFIIPYQYLRKLTDKTDNEYTLLNTYKEVDEYFRLYGNADEHLKHQFGSSDENSFSLKTDFKDAIHYIPQMASSIAICDGYVNGAETIKYNTMLAADAYIDIIGFGAPDLVVFENNYITYAHLIEKVDAESLAQSGMEKGAFYQHTTKESTIEVTKDKADIVNPNPEDYE